MTRSDAPQYPGAGDLTLALPRVTRRRRKWPWLLGAVALVAAAVSSWVLVVAPARAGATTNAVPIGATFTYPSGLAVTVSDVNAYTSTNAVVVPPGDTAYRGTVTVLNGTTTPVRTALMIIGVATGPVVDDRIFENAPPPTQDIAPGQQLQVPFAFTVAKQAVGPLRVTVTAALDQAPAIFTDAVK